MTTRTRTKRKRPATRTPEDLLPDDMCPTCATPMRERKARLRFPINSEDVSVPGAVHLRCSRCHEIVLRMDHARQLREHALEIYRKKYKLLSSTEIRSIRERFSLTQAQLARLLRLGGNTISRWEAGRNVQTAAMDVLLRLIRDIPGSLDYLRKHAE